MFFYFNKIFIAFATPLNPFLSTRSMLSAPACPFFGRFSFFSLIIFHPSLFLSFFYPPDPCYPRLPAPSLAGSPFFH